MSPCISPIIFGNNNAKNTGGIIMKDPIKFFNRFFHNNMELEEYDDKDSFEDDELDDEDVDDHHLESDFF